MRIRKARNLFTPVLLAIFSVLQACGASNDNAPEPSQNCIVLTDCSTEHTPLQNEEAITAEQNQLFDCTTAEPTRCLRGMYWSPYTDGIGKIVFSGDDQIYSRVLGDANKEQLVLDFIEAHQINSLSLYLQNILTDELLSAHLKDFMQRARAIGVQRIEAVAGSTKESWDNIYRFHQTHSRFDGFVTEIEFWRETESYGDFLEALRYVRSLNFRSTHTGETPTIAAYLGWPTDDEIQQLVPLIDRALIHVYVTSADSAYAYAEDRLQAFAAAAAQQITELEIMPIFSAEGTAYSAGTEHFMGEWLQNNGIPAAEAELQMDIQTNFQSEAIKLVGFQYYSYYFLRKYLN